MPPLYAMNMCDYHWLIQKLPLAYGREEYSKMGNSSRNGGGWKAESGKRHVDAQKTRRKITNHKPYGKI